MPGNSRLVIYLTAIDTVVIGNFHIQPYRLAALDTILVRGQTALQGAADRDDIEVVTISIINPISEFVSQYIDKILVTPQDDETLKLEIKIFTGETMERYLNNLRQKACVAFAEDETLMGRTGHTSKKMIPI